MLIYLLTYVSSCIIKNHAHLQVRYLMSALKSKRLILFDKISTSIHPKFSLKILIDPWILNLFSNMTIRITHVHVSGPIVALNLLSMPQIDKILWYFLFINPLQYPIPSVCLPHPNDSEFFSFNNFIFYLFTFNKRVKNWKRIGRSYKFADLTHKGNKCDYHWFKWDHRRDESASWIKNTN